MRTVMYADLSVRRSKPSGRTLQVEQVKCQLVVSPPRLILYRLVETILIYRFSWPAANSSGLERRGSTRQGFCVGQREHLSLPQKANEKSLAEHKVASSLWQALGRRLTSLKETRDNRDLRTWSWGPSSFSISDRANWELLMENESLVDY